MEFLYEMGVTNPWTWGCHGHLIRRPVCFDIVSISLDKGCIWAYREAYGDGCITKKGLIYPLIEDDVFKVHSVDIYFKSMVMVKEINKELLIHFLLSEDIQKTEEKLMWS